MSNYRHLVVIDLSSYGSALAVINQFCDDEGVKVFEISPLGTAALLILMTKDTIAAAVLKNEIQSQMNSTVLSLAVIENSHEDLLPTYLSQRTNSSLKNLLILESSSVAEALLTANDLLKQDIKLLDLRIVRTFPCNVILTLTSDSEAQILKIKDQQQKMKPTVVLGLQPTLKNYYQTI